VGGQVAARDPAHHWAKAIRAKDVDGSRSAYAPGVLAFDLINSLRYVATDAVRQRLKEWFSLFEGRIGYENRDLSITPMTSPSATASTTQRRPKGKRSTCIGATVCFHKIDGEWMVRIRIARCLSTWDQGGVA
jgi:ketosteroid isomerase-like protein